MTARFSGLGITNAGGAFSRVLRIPDFREFFGEFSASIGRTLRIESTRGGVVPAMALKRFQLKHGKLPGAPNELPPEFFPAVPIDPHDGKSLRYRPNDDGTYLLYSVGEDGRDDGGDPINVAIGSSSFYWQNNRPRLGLAAACNG